MKSSSLSIVGVYYQGSVIKQHMCLNGEGYPDGGEV